MPENQNTENRTQDAEITTQGSEDIETRPYPNEHACRLRNPGDFNADSFRRTTREHKGKKYSVIMGKLKGEDSMTEQAYRYDKEKWPASEAKSHCKEHDGSFEAAKDMKSENPDNIERRIITFENSELRISEDGKPMLSGYAAKFNTWTSLGWFEEKIAPGFFDDVLKDDVRCLKNHNPDLILGRTTNGTLRLKINSVGLYYENDLPDTNTGRDVREEVKTKLITGCSFAFTLKSKGGQDWPDVDEGKLPQRILLKCEELYDCGPVTYPAYPDTSVAARSLEAVRNQNTENRTQNTENRTQTAPAPASGNTKKQMDDERGTKDDKLTPDPQPLTPELTFEQKFEYEKNVRKAERLANRLKKAKQA